MTLKSNQTLSDLKAIDAKPGTLEWIGIRPARKAELQSLSQVELIADYGLSGDHRAQKQGSKRQITLIQYEYLAVIAQILGKTSIDPILLRRNCAISGINVNSLRDQIFTIGDIVLEGTGYCHPCSRMEENLGPGGYNAVRGHGGINAKILTSGTISIGDSVIRQNNE